MSFSQCFKQLHSYIADNNCWFHYYIDFPNVTHYGKAEIAFTRPLLLSYSFEHLWTFVKWNLETNRNRLQNGGEKRETMAFGGKERSFLGQEEEVYLQQKRRPISRRCNEMLRLGCLTIAAVCRCLAWCSPPICHNHSQFSH